MQMPAPALDSVSVTDPGPHAEHEMCDSDEYRPASQGLQLTPPADTTLPLLTFTTDPDPHPKHALTSPDPDTTTYRPLAHAVQADADVAPSVSPYRPALQSTHRIVDCVEYWPLLQAVQVVAPAAARVSVTLPGPHAEHDSCFVNCWCWPGWQLEQAELPLVLWYRPAAHSRHDDSSLSSRKKPAGQSWQRLEVRSAPALASNRPGKQGMTGLQKSLVFRQSRVPSHVQKT